MSFNRGLFPGLVFQKPPVSLLITIHMKAGNLTSLVRITAGICGVALLICIFVPLWQIELAAPQYPEGLVLKMYPGKLAGNVDIINGLNHYIGMKTLHTEDFVEFTVLPYIIGFFAVFCLAVAFFLKTFRWLLGLFILFVLFGVVSMVDFYRWEYQYGHDLDPNAAINVPGMSYQPPLIGYKQLLNFGAYSVPDIGGWIFIGVGLALLSMIIFQYKIQKKMTINIHKRRAWSVLSILLTWSLVSCSTSPQPIKVGSDACHFCKMGVADKRFGAELITRKGKVYKFDDLHCLLEFQESNTVKPEAAQSVYVVDFESPHGFVRLEKAFLLHSEALRSPMGSNVAAFSSRDAMLKNAKNFKGDQVSLDVLIPQSP